MQGNSSIIGSTKTMMMGEKARTKQLILPRAPIGGRGWGEKKLDQTFLPSSHGVHRAAWLFDSVWAWHHDSFRATGLFPAEYHPQSAVRFSNVIGNSVKVEVRYPHFL